MRRFICTGSLAVCAALVVTCGAAAKWGIELASTPEGLAPGDRWRVEIRVVGTHVSARAGEVPLLRIRNRELGIERHFRSQAVPGARRTYETAVRFPAPGRWGYAVLHAGASFRFPPVVIAEDASPSASAGADSQAPPARGSSGDGGFPVWALVSGSLATALAALFGIARFRGLRALTQ